MQQHRRFKPGDRVQGTGSPFWMTVREILLPLKGVQRCRCTFGSSHQEAGTWLATDLKPFVVERRRRPTNVR